MTTELIREKLRTLYEEAGGAHPGLLLQRGLPEHQEGENGSKTNHIKRVCKLTPDAFYRNAYKRWHKATSDKQRFHQVQLVLENRLFIGLTGGGMLETGCAIGHSYGAPYIPGSSIKGVVLAHAREGFDTVEGKAVCDELFGAPATGDQPTGLSGLITFHDAWWVPDDAWWVPDSARHPLVQEVVTSHHPDYYGEDGKEPATDFDSPVPNAQVAVQGAFLFTIEGPVAWLPLAEDMLIAALSTHGIGAKTRAGYGTMKLDPQWAKKREAHAAQREEERRKHQAKKEEAARRQAEKAEFNALPEGRKRIVELERMLARISSLDQLSESLRNKVKSSANRLADMDAWSDAEERKDAADLLERVYEVIGWYDPGRNRKQRDKQHKKKRDAIARVRGS